MKKINIAIHFSNNLCRVNYGEKQFNYSYGMISKNSKKSLAFFIIGSLKDVLLKMPDQQIDFNFSLDESINNQLIEYIQEICKYVVMIMNNTQACIERSIKNEFSGNHNVLFLGLPKEKIGEVIKKPAVSNSWFERFFEHHKDETDEKSFFYYFPTDILMNPLKRIFEKTGVIFSIADLSSLFRKNKIKKLVIQNFYLYETFLSTQGIYLPVILNYVGIEGIGIDYDPSEYGDIVNERAMFNIEKNTRFCPYPLFEEYWDRKYNLKNVRYEAMLDHYSSEKIDFQLKKEYSILVLSNSRVDAVKSDLAAIIFVLSGLNESNIFKEFQLWYFSLRDIIQNRIKVFDYDKQYFLARIFRIFYNTSQFLKYEVLESLKTNRAIKIYGDEGWNTLFPEYYQNKFLSKSEIDELYSKKENLLLCFNMGVDYLQTSGAVIDSINNNVPFINFPMVVKDNEFIGFESIEFNNVSELNDKINVVDKLFQNDSLLHSIAAYKKIMKTSEKRVVDYIFNDKKLPVDEGIYYKKIIQKREILNEEINRYIEQNQFFLKKCMDVLLNNHSYNVDINKTRFYNRQYIKRIIKRA